MNLNNWFDKGLLTDEYEKQLDDHKDNYYNIFNNYEVPEDEEFFSQLKNKNWRAIVLAEVWCGHCMLNIPIFLKIAEKANMPVRFLNRDENLELMDEYLTNGNRVIPIFIFIDEDGNEVAKWGPMAETTRKFVAPLRENIPPKDDETYEEKFREMVKITSKEFSSNEELWNGVYESFKETLS
ncbi:MAG TPA: thioredoxin family protein [Bacillota bacterium]|nr:thioredoxin family protein [Bacillota bacterium]